MAARQASANPVCLVVEDEPFLRMDAADMARDAGYDVVEAENADEAIGILESRNDIQVIFTDINMPGSMDGLKLAAAVRNRWPPIEIIVTSGVHKLSAADLPERGVFLSKPYDRNDVTAALSGFRPRQ